MLKDSVVVRLPAGLAKGQTQEQVAEKIGTSAPTVSRWLAGQKASAATAVAVARAYGDSPLNALVAVGFITADEARQRPSAQPSLEGITDDELIELVTNRIKREGEGHADGSATTKPPGTGPANQPVLREVGEHEVDYAARDPETRQKPTL